MRKLVLVMLAAVLAILLAAVPAMAQSQTFMGTNSNDLSDPANWSPTGYPWQSPIVIDNSDPYHDLVDSRGVALASAITFNRTGGASLDKCYAAWGGTGGITVQNAATYNIGVANVWNTNAVRFDVANGGVLNLGLSGINNNEVLTFAGTGTTNLGTYQTYSAPSSWVFESAHTMSATYLQDYGPQPITSMTGAAGTANLTGNWAFQANNYAFGGQIVLHPAAGARSFVKFVNADGSLASTVTGVKVNLAGRVGTTALLVGGGNQTFVNSTITGDGNIFCNTVSSTSNNYGYGPFTTLTAKGGTIAPSNSGVAGTNAFGGASTNGQMVVMGNLVFDKNADGKNTQLVVGVTGTGGNLGADYSQLSIQYGGTINSASNIAAAGTNYLADADLVVNITKGLNNTLLAGQTLKILDVNSTDLRTSSFGNITFVGGTATVTPMHTDPYWYPAWDDPNRVYVDATNWLQLSNIVSNPSAIAGDCDSNGKVDDNDLNALLSAWNKGTTWADGNFKGTGVTDDNDLNALLSNWGKTSGAAVPEPVTLSLLAIGGIALLRRK